MPNNVDRAFQFQPFDALKGFKEALKMVEKNAETKKEFNDNFWESLNATFKKIKIGDKVIVKHYYALEYIETMGTVKKIDVYERILYINQTKISFDDIVDIML